MDKKLLNKIRFLRETQGTSMVPVIRPGDGLYLSPVSFDKIRLDDVIAFERINELVIHRVVYKTKTYVITRGDANEKSDGRIYENDIVGKVIDLERKGKKIDMELLYFNQSSIYLEEITKIKFLLEKYSINHVFLKGLPLYLYFEDSHPKRIYADCDLLVGKNDVRKTMKILEENRYVKVNIPIANTGPVAKKSRGEFSFIKRINGFPVVFDIHTEAVFVITKIGSLDALYPQVNVDKISEELLINKIPIIIYGQPFLILNSPFLIMYLALHIFNHDFRGAFRYRFLDTVIKKCRPTANDWEKIQLIINNYRLNNFVYPVFILLKKYYKTPFPGQFIRNIQPVNPLTRKLVNLLISTNIFDDPSRFRAGVNRFINLFLLSPNPWRKRLLVFTNLNVIYFICWALSKRLKSLLGIKV